MREASRSRSSAVVRRLFCFAVVLCAAVAPQASATSISWIGGSGDWNRAANWSPAQVPGAGDDAVIDANATVIVVSTASASFNTLTLGDASGSASPVLKVDGSFSSAGSLTVEPKATFQQESAQQLSLSQVTVASGGKITHSANSSTRAFIVDLNVSGDFALQAGATIAADGMGYAAGYNWGRGYGPGAGTNASGGGHGGNGGDCFGSCSSSINTTSFSGGTAYDSLTAPVDLGSGGGGTGGYQYGGAGGGAVILQVGGTLTLNGAISANGVNINGGGGGGGTVNITATNLAGTGLVRVNGGPGSAGGGGGGRIAIVVSGSDASALSLQAAGGTGSSYSGGVGVIATKGPGETNYSLMIGTQPFVPQALTPITGPGLAFDTVTLGNGLITFDTSTSLSINALVAVGTTTLTTGDITLGASAEVRPGAVLRLTAASTTGGNLVIDGRGALVQTNAVQLSFSSLSVQPGGVLTHAANGASRAAVVDLNIAGDATVQAGGAIMADSMGYAPGYNWGKGSGPGAGTNASGGGHGGNGGDCYGSCSSSINTTSFGGGTAYDSLTAPSDLGSGGGGSGNYQYGGAGGGAVILQIGGTLTINGAISANGGGANAGGGAGGSVNITATNLAGTGIVRANGGSGAAGGGGGGRVAVVVTGADASALALQANGGTGGSFNGGAGVIAKRAGSEPGFSLLIGTQPVIPQALTPVAGSSLAFDTVTLGNVLLNFDPGSNVSINALVVPGSATVTAANLAFGSTVEAKGGSVLKLAAGATSGGNLLIDARGMFVQTNTSQLGFGSIALQPGAVMTHAGNSTTRAAILDLNVTGDVTVPAGAAIIVDGLGYAPGSNWNQGYGPGAGTNASGGGHGGNGGDCTGSCSSSIFTTHYAGGAGGYDNPTSPIDLGSGGGGGGGQSGGAGGGALIIAAGGTVTIDGIVSANGRNGNGGGGAGGSINITAATMAGAGLVRANGGTGSGAGGGGIIAVAATTANGFTGGLFALAGASNGGSGLVAVRQPGSTLFDLVVGSGATTAPQTVTPIPGSALSLNDVSINDSNVAFTTGSTIDLNALVASGTVTATEGSWTFGPAGMLVSPRSQVNMAVGGLTFQPTSPLQVGSAAQLNLAAMSLSGGNLDVSGTFRQTTTIPYNFNSANIESGGVLTHGANSASRQNMVNLNITTDFTLSSNASIRADGLGYSGGGRGAAGAGPGAGASGSNQSGPGGSHGGSGGRGDLSSSGATYDSLIFPADLGSGGGGGSGYPGSAGGGAIVLQAGGNMTINGTVSANGAANGSGGGGAGGSIAITANTIAGSGTVRANGGSSGGGGGGGRIALGYVTKSGSLSLSATAGSSSAGVGTIVDNGRLVSYSSPASTPTADLAQTQEKLSTSQSLSETIAAQTLDFSGATSTGVTPGTFTQAQIQLVTVQTGGFAGDGFFRGSWTMTFPSGQTLSGSWQGTAALNASGQMVLEGSIENGIRGVLEGVLSQSAPGSGVFDRLALNCSALQIGDQVGATSLYFSGSAGSNQTLQYPNVGLNEVQSSVTGQASGYIVGPLETTFTLVTIASPGNPFNGAGFFLPNYSSSLGTGSGFAYMAPSGQVSGLFGQPLRGLFEGALVAQTPRSLIFTLERLDVGLPVQPILTIIASGPQIANSGQVNGYFITVRNDGYAAANGLSLIASFPDWADFVSATNNYIVYNTSNWWNNTSQFSPKPFLRWDIAQIPPRTSLNFSYQARVRLPLPSGPPAHAILDGGVAELVTTSWAQTVFAGYPAKGVQ